MCVCVCVCLFVCFYGGHLQTQVLHNQRADEAVDLSDHSMDDHSEMSASGSHDFPDAPRQHSRSQDSNRDSPVEPTAQYGGRSESSRGSSSGRGSGSAGMNSA